MSRGLSCVEDSSVLMFHLYNHYRVNRLQRSTELTLVSAPLTFEPCAEVMRGREVTGGGLCSAYGGLSYITSVTRAAHATVGARWGLSVLG